MRCEYATITRSGNRIEVHNPSRTISAKAFNRLKADNENKSFVIRAMLVAVSILAVLLVTVLVSSLYRVDQLNAEIAEMADRNLQEVTAISDQYKTLFEEYRALEKEKLDLEDLVEQYEEILPFVEGSWDYYNPSVPLDADLQAATWRIGSMRGIEPEILFGIMRKESGFNPNAISADGHDYGICQIRDSNHAWLRSNLGQLDFMDAVDNITSAAYIIEDIRDRYGYTDWNKILVVYNMGPGNAEKYFAEGHTSSSYSRQVLQYAAEYGFKN